MPQVQTRPRPEPDVPARSRVYGGGDRGGPGDGGRPARKKRRKDPLWARLVVIFGALLMVGSGLTVVGTKAIIGRYAGAVTQQSLLGGAATSPQDARKALNGPINLLLLGVDERARSAGDMRSDTIIMLHVPASHDQAYLVSVPRDLWVNVPAFPKAHFGGGNHKITEAFYFGSRNGLGRAGGAELVAMTIKNLTGISFNGAAIIDFNGFKGVIDSLGGVHMCVDQRVKSAHMRMVDGKATWLADARKVGGGQTIWHEKGCRDMAGWEALDFARQRYGLKNSDYDRQRHQQQLIKAIVKKAMTGGVVTNPLKLDKVIKSAGKAFVLDTNSVPIEDFIFTLKGVAANDLVMIRTNAGKINPASIPGTSAEALTPTSVELFDAVKGGGVAQFVAAHPDFVAGEK
jgi:LCP family protein required for cell wall assembly